MLINEKKRTCHLVEFIIPKTPVKMKESEKRDKYLDLSREIKKTGEHEDDGNNNSLRP